MAQEVLGFNSYRLAMICAVVGAGILNILTAVRRGASGLRFVSFNLALIAVSVLGAKVYAVCERGDYSVPLLDMTRELRYPGGIVAAAIAAPALLKMFRPGISLLTFADSAAPSVAIGFSIMRIGCFLAGCCFGVPSALPWAVSFPTPSPALDEQIRIGIVSPHAVRSVPVHPLQLYSAGVSVIVGVWLLRRRVGRPGETLALFLLLHEGSRFLLEFLRAPVHGHTHADLKVISLSLSLLGAAILYQQRRKPGPEGEEVHPLGVAAAGVGDVSRTERG